MTGPSYLPGGFATGQTAADDVNFVKHSLYSIVGIFIMATEPKELAPRQAPGPIDSTERILDLDILRGMALFGILAANMRGFSAPLDLYFDIGKWFPAAHDRYAQMFIDIFVQRKFITLFFFMFGIGFAAQFQRAEARGQKFVLFYPRRLAALALFGLLHGILIWSGDILLTYAFAGLLLLAFRDYSQRAILAMVGWIAFVPALAITGYALASPALPAAESIDLARVAGVIPIYAYGSLPAILKQNWIEWIRAWQSQGNVDSWWSEGFAVCSVSLFLLGLWVVRAGILEHLAEYGHVFKRVAMVCVPIGVALNIAAVVVAVYPQTVVRVWVGGLLGAYSAPVLSAGYAAGLMVLLQDPAWRRTLTPFAAMGRTALSNYLVQSVICVAFFRLNHLYGIWGPAWDLLPTVVLFAVQVVISNWWLKHYRFGPMEWVWRGVTYGFPRLENEKR